MFTQSTKTDSNRTQNTSTKQEKAKTKPNPLQGVLDDPGLLLSPKNILQLQRTIGNRAVIQLLKSQFKQQYLLQPVQRMEFEEEELQMKRESVIQSVEDHEDEDELQMKPEYGAIQRVELPDEEELLMKQDNTIQRAEDEKLQMKKDSIFQRKEIEIPVKEIPVKEIPKSFNNTINPLAVHPKINRPSLFQPPIQKKNDQTLEHRENNTGMPDNLKSGLEALSGLSLSDVRVHRNSDKPPQVGALAYTQGTEIHVAPGQEQHLPHEGWHVVQQKQGRVQATTQAAGLPVNDEPVLENEADVMGEKALQMKDSIDRNNLQNQNDISEDVASASDIIQRTKWFWNGVEWESLTPTSNQPPKKVGKYGDYIDDGIEEKEEKKEEKEKEETIDDLKKRCGSASLSVGTYNKGVEYAQKEFSFKGELSHGHDSMHLFPKARLQEMCDAGATISQLKKVLEIWGR